MSTISYLKGDATDPKGDGPKVIAHVCNDLGKWGKGFVLALSRRWKQPEVEYRKWSSGRTGVPFELGEVQFVEVYSPAGKLWVANMIGQHGIGRGPGGVPPIRYPAIAKALAKVSAFAVEKGATIHAPRFGAGLAGGNWTEIEKKIRENVTVPVTIYDF